MRNRNAATNARGTKSLTLQKRFKNFPIATTGRFRGARREFLKRLLLVLHFQRRQNRRSGQKVIEHELIPLRIRSEAAHAGFEGAGP
jgi:hypothetical protein